MSSMAPTVFLEKPLAQVQGGIDRLGQEDLQVVPTSCLGDDLRGIRAAIDRLEAEFSRRLEQFDRNRGYVIDGHASTAGWLSGQCRITRSTAWERVRQARRLMELPSTKEAFAAGEISQTHVGVITRAAEQVGCEALRDAEPILLEAARQLDARQLRYVTAQLRHCLDPDGAVNDANCDYERRHLYLSELMDGMYAIDGLLDAEGGALVREALEALMGPPERGDERTGSQRRADSLVEMAHCHLDRGDLPQGGCQRPHLMVISQLDTLKAEPGAPGGRAGQPPAGVRGTGPPHRLDCSMTRVELGPDSELLSVGRATRVIPAPMRKALILRDRHCQFPGCDRPARWSDAHHLQHWIDGGPTVLVNLALLCRRCHRRVHEGRWRLVRDLEGRLRAIPP